MALLQIAIPLTDDRAGLTTAVVVAFAVTTTLLAAMAWGGSRAVAAGTVVLAGALALEAFGTRTGWPFGDYDYGDALRPTVAGVPLAVGLAWWAMAVPARDVAARVVAPGWRRVALGAVALTAWDVLLDPQMVDEGFWTWDGGGPWRDVPLSNYVGWFLVSVVVMVVLDRLLPGSGRGPALLGLYTWWAAMSTLGFLAFFGDPLVGVVGGACMLPLAGLAWRAELRA
ncbi:MAG TPA: carotenoid biosynthesis protein [Acidimicrobiales bacterium]|nr:carotenoid biosynthesis protein [Acidimicrobiales bacterium]